MIFNKIKETSFTREYITEVYEKWVIKSFKAFERKEYSKSIKYMTIAARWMYNFNIIYSDQRLEKLIKDISKCIFEKKQEYDEDEDCIVFLDSIGSVKCLDLQYLRGLMKLQKKIVYILHNDTLQCGPIINELKQYKKSTILVIKENEYSHGLEIAKKINKVIFDNKASAIILHMVPQDVVSLISISNLSTPIIFNINLQDHTFWLGAGIINYNIEFRSYGEKISIEKRNLKKEQLIRLPYYPITNNKETFRGLPKLPDDAIIIFAGGAQYKMLGKNDIFFRMMDIILDCSPKAYILVATIGDNILFSQKKHEMRNGIRVILLGMRDDINEVFKHSDIYLSSYPFIGGLMTQYAAANAIPILAFAEKNEANIVEEMVNHKLIAAKSNFSLEQFRSYAKELINNEAFRKSEGDKNKQAIINEDDFPRYLLNALKYKTTELVWNQEVNPDYEGMINFYINNENFNIHAGLKSMITYLKLKVFLYFPLQTITIIQCVIRWLKTRR